MRKNGTSEQQFSRSLHHEKTRAILRSKRNLICVTCFLSRPTYWSFHKSHLLSITGSHVFTKMFVICAGKMNDLMKELQQHDVVLWGAVSSHDIVAVSISRHASPTDQLHSIRVSLLTVYEQVNTRNLFYSHLLYSEGSRQTILSSERRAHLNFCRSSH